MDPSNSTFLSFVPKFYSAVALEAEPTLGTPLNRVVPVMNIVSAGTLSWFQLVAGTSGTITPNDANASTNQVSWKQVL